ncbi:MAG: hypothetical protein K6V36_12830 [Anaerolineae bacterium]|nr:hypothetical protein [Anaerolineae bacterium]
MQDALRLGLFAPVDLLAVNEEEAAALAGRELDPSQPEAFLRACAAVLRPGDAPVAAAVTDRAGLTWRVGLSVCYDLRFPELYRLLAADVLVVPAAFTYVTGQAHWEVLLRARAIENQAYVIASAQGGQHENGRQTWGQSMVIDPWGQVLAQQATGPGVVVAELDRAHQQEVRRRLPALEHRRL